MISERGLTKNQIIQELTRSPHGKLDEYVPVGQTAQTEEPEFFAHLISWNGIRGQVRDARVALPVIALSCGKTHSEFSENALAHMCTLDPRNFLRSLRFARELKTPEYGKSIRRAVEQYLWARETNYKWWEKAAVQHRSSMKELYALYHVKPAPFANAILFLGTRPKNSVFEAIAELKNMSAIEAAGTILERKIPFLIAIGALGKRARESDLVLALIERMSPTELVTNMKRLEKLGVKSNPALRSALEQSLKKAAKSNENILKTTVAAEAVEDDAIRSKLQGLQEKQMQRAAGIDGNWLVLGDKSGSMQKCIETSRHVAAMLAKMVRGQVHLIFFDIAPRHVDATGKTYEQLLEMTKHVTAGGGTSIGCGLEWALERGIEIDGIAIVSDAAENNLPLFVNVYQFYSRKYDKQVPVYLYRMEPGTRALQDRDLAETMRLAKFDMQEFDLRGGVDYYSMPNIVATMRSNRYSLVDEIMATPLLTLDKVFK